MSTRKIKALVILVLLLGLVLPVSTSSSNVSAQDPQPYYKGIPCELPLASGELMLNPELSLKGETYCKAEIKRLEINADIAARSQDREPGEYLLGFASEEKLIVQRVNLKDQGYQILRELSQINAILVRSEEIRSMADVESDVERIAETVDAAWIEPNYHAYAAETTLQDDWYLSAVGAHATSVTCDPNVGMAILDTGVFTGHQELPNVIPVWDYVEGDSFPTDGPYDPHGTLVASLAAGLNTGICQGGTVLDYRVLDENGSGTYADIAEAIADAAVDSRVRVINMSLSGPEDSEAIAAALQLAMGNGKIVVAAAGNDLGEYPGYPARDANTLAVGATDWRWRLTTWSSRFEGIDRAMVAPGAYMRGADNSCSTCYATASGTSLSSPLVAGTMALVWSQNTAESPAGVENIVTSNAIPLGDAREYGMGGLHVGAAVNAATTEQNMPPQIIWPQAWPDRGAPGDELSVIARMWDANDDTMTSTVTITSPTLSTVVWPMSYDGEFWTVAFTPTVTGVYSAAISVTDGVSVTTLQEPLVFHVVSEELATGWNQISRDPRGSSYIPYSIDIGSSVQIYSEWNRGGGGRDTVVSYLGQANIPDERRIVSGPACPTGNSYGRIWLYNSDHGIKYGYYDYYDDAIELSCWDGAAVGMFPDSGAFGGHLFVLDEGSGRSDSQDSRLHAFDMTTGEQEALIQLEYHGGGAVKISEDGERLYTVHSMYNPMWAIDSRTFERLWSFQPYSWVSFYSEPVEYQDTLYVKVTGNVESGLYALDGRTGDVLWRYNSGYTDGYGSPAVSPEHEAVVYCSDATVWSVGLDGDLNWQTSLGDGYCDADTVVTGNYVVQAAKVDSPQLYLLNMFTGEIMSQIEVVSYGSSSSSPTVVGDYVFLADYDGRVGAYSVPDLDQVWTATIDPYNLSRWQMSAAVVGSVGSQKVRVSASGNNGYHKAWDFDVIGSHEPKYVVLEVSKTAPTEVTSGDSITYTLAVTNTGNITASVTVFDNIPLGTSVQDPGTGAVNGGVIDWPEVVMMPGETVIRSFVVTASTHVEITIVNENYGACDKDWGCTIGDVVSTVVVPLRTYLPVVLK